MAATDPHERPGLARRILGLIVGICMMLWGGRSLWSGVREMRRGGEVDALLARPEPPPTPTRAWEACSPEEVAYAASRPAWVSAPGIDFSAPWSLTQHVAAASTVFPSTLATDSPLPRDCSPSSGAAFQRFISVDGIRAIVADESADLEARVGAVGRAAGALGGPAALYCGAVWLDDYQWECARLTTASLVVVTTMLPLAARAEQDEPSLGRNASWTQGLATMRGAIVETCDDALRLLELSGGVRPSVRALLAHMLAEDYAAARALILDTAPLPALRQRLADQVAREPQTEVRDALALALQRWP